MTLVYNPVSQCQGKRGYRTKAYAKRAARRIPGHRLQAYRCPHCDAFHVGHPVHRPAEPKPVIIAEPTFEQRRAASLAKARAERGFRLHGKVA